VDIGFLLDRVIANHFFVAQFPGTTLTPKAFNFVSGAEQTLAWYSANDSGRATTNLTTSLIEPQGPVSATAASDLTRLGYQLFVNKNGSYTFNRDITAGLFISNNVRTDYINRMTTNILKDALDVARDESRGLLGTVNSFRAREGLKQRLEQEFSKWAHPEDGRLRKPATVKVSSTGVRSVIGSVVVELGLAVAGEILEIRVLASQEQ
jgi:hypothetical protein